MAAWPDFNRMIGGYFKWHWNDPTHIVYKIDDPNSPLTQMFLGGGPFEIDDETYTFSVNADSYSRANLRVLTSVDYSKMSPEDKAKEDFPREDDDYGLSWIRREGKGRVFYEAHGHNERVYGIKTMLEHILAGVQYAMGDLAADDSPSVKR
jgi:type 1 glutamine amidotransferase